MAEDSTEEAQKGITISPEEQVKAANQEELGRLQAENEYLRRRNMVLRALCNHYESSPNSEKISPEEISPENAES